MKKIMVLILVCVCFCCCSNEQYKKDFIGTWDDRPNGLQNNIVFYNDSVVLWSYCRKSVGTWGADSSQLFLYFPYDPNDPNRDGNSILQYKFNKSKDSLYVIVENDSMEHLMMKVNDYWSHFLKYFDLTIDIPVAGPLASLIKVENTRYPNIYIGWQDNTLTVRGSNSLTSKPLFTKKDYMTFLVMNTSDELLDQKLHPCTLIVDKNVSEKQLDSVKAIINDFGFENTYFFQVYNLEERKFDYGYIKPDCFESMDWYWYGRYDWNGLE